MSFGLARRASGSWELCGGFKPASGKAFGTADTAGVRLAFVFAGAAGAAPSSSSKSDPAASSASLLAAFECPRVSAIIQIATKIGHNKAS